MVLFDYIKEWVWQEIDRKFFLRLYERQLPKQYIIYKTEEISLFMSQLEKMMYFVKLKGNNPKSIEHRNIAPCIPESFTP